MLALALALDAGGCAISKENDVEDSTEVTPQPPFNASRVKVTIRAERTQPQGKTNSSPAGPNLPSARFLDRCDLVSSRSRTEVLRGLSQQLSLDAETAKLFAVAFAECIDLLRRVPAAQRPEPLQQLKP